VTKLGNIDFYAVDSCMLDGLLYFMLYV